MPKGIHFFRVMAYCCVLGLAPLTEPWQWPGGAWTGLWVAWALLDVGGVWVGMGGHGWAWAGVGRADRALAVAWWGLDWAMGCHGAAGRWWSLVGRGRAWAGLTEPWQ